MNSLSVKAKFQMGQFESLKQIFFKFEGQFYLEGSRSRSQDFRIVKDLWMINTQVKFKGKIAMVQTLLPSQGINKFLSFKANLTLNVKVKVTSFQTHPRHLDAR